MVDIILCGKPKIALFLWILFHYVLTQTVSINVSRKSTSSIDLSSFMVLLLLPLAHFRDRYAYTFFGGQIRTSNPPYIYTYLSKHGLAINHDSFRHISNYHGRLFKKGRNHVDK